MTNLCFYLLLISAALIGLSLFLRLRRPHSPSFPLFKCAAFVLFIAITTLVLWLHTLLETDRPVLKVTMTGAIKNEWVEWKNPQGVMSKQLLPTYEVRLETVEGKNLGSHFILGDQVAVKAKVIRFAPLLNALGIKNRCQIQGLHNSYNTTVRGNTQPVQYCDLPIKHKFLWHLWEPLYLQEQESALIHSAALESNYFPLVDRQGHPVKKSYLLTINPGGLSSISSSN